MDKIEHFKKVAMSFFIVVTFVNIAMGILGLCFERDMKFGYEAFFVPIIYGFLSMIPMVMTYSKKELTVRQLIFRKILHLLLLEALLTYFVFLNKAMAVDLLISFMISVFVISILVHMILWFLDNRKAKELNLELEEYQKNRIL